MLCQFMLGPGGARQGLAGEACRGKARQGEAGLGMAGKARNGLARQG